MNSFIALTAIASWITSLIYCVPHSEWLAVIVLHVLLAPIGIIHGMFVWFGASWF